MILLPTCSTLFPYTTLFRSSTGKKKRLERVPILADRFWTVARCTPTCIRLICMIQLSAMENPFQFGRSEEHTSDSSHVAISYAVFCLKKKNDTHEPLGREYL